MTTWTTPPGTSDTTDRFDPQALDAAAAPTQPVPFSHMAVEEQAVPAGDPALVAKHLSGSAWFFWIAGLSIVNSVAAALDTNWGFLIGLGVTQAIDAIAKAAGGGFATMIALALDSVAALVFVGLGILARRRHLLAYIVGIALFGLDGLLFLVVRDWIGLGFHVFALVFIIRGFLACRFLEAR